MAARGLVHNDIKEDNVCIKFSGHGIEITFIDFGLANPLGNEVYLFPLQPESWNKYPWVAPEVLAGGCSSVASDTYSLASLLIFMYDKMSLSLPQQAAVWAKTAIGNIPENRTKVNTFLQTFNPLSIACDRNQDEETELLFRKRRKTKSTKIQAYKVIRSSTERKTGSEETRRISMECEENDVVSEIRET
ncbi:hypothetical protein Pcinc_039217 [Petrolisthes cinctipes]|uniref:Protein kinase domain-containing protein n=1 Tax=Petrolisthes cinctipes TaxID=88211 RepID=A0AAE1EKS8_PETCI|nr:hypothetical protein Pcinc_039217 [Petrolisthes cinctipes]